MIRLLGLFATAGVLLALVPAPVHATPLVYTEASSGDLPESAPFPVLPLGVGANTVSGSSVVTLDSTHFTNHDFDSFRFTVPVGAQLTSINYTSTITNSVTPVFVQFDEFLALPNLSVIAEEFIKIFPGSGTGGATLSSFLPLGPGEYQLSQGQLEGAINESVNWDYTWTLQVSAIPEPASVVLLAGALSLAWLGRRHRA